MPPESGDLTQLLEAAREGDDTAVAALMEAVYAELRKLAASYLQGERPDHTLQPTALVHEAYLKLIDQRKTDYESRGHFIALAATAMRRILVDHARGKGRHKRGGDRRRIALDDAQTAVAAGDHVDIVALDEAMGRLTEISDRAVRTVELRYFVGLTVEQAAEVLGVSAPTVKRDWEFARTWLLQALEGDG